jgi:hypothetical protein
MLRSVADETEEYNGSQDVLMQSEFSVGMFLMELLE